MSDIPTRPPAPAPPLPAGWTEHKAPSGSSHGVPLIAHSSRFCQDTPTSTTRRRRNPPTRALSPSRRTYAATFRPLHPRPSARRQATAPRSARRHTTAAPAPSPPNMVSIHSSACRTSSSGVRQDRLSNRAGHTPRDAADTVGGSVEGTVALQRGRGRRKTGQSIAMTYQTARPGSWLGRSWGGDLCGTRTQTKAFGSFHQTS